MPKEAHLQMRRAGTLAQWLEKSSLAICWPDPTASLFSSSLQAIFSVRCELQFYSFMIKMILPGLLLRI